MELTLQKHFYRSEHCSVVSVTAEVIYGKEVFLLTEKDSTYIPRGEIHWLANPRETELELMEFQFRNYRGEAHNL